MVDPGGDLARRRAPPPNRERDGIATVAALLAHVAVLAIAWRFAGQTPATAPTLQGPGETDAAALIEIDLHEDETSPRRPSRPAEPEMGLRDKTEADRQPRGSDVRRALPIGGNGGGADARAVPIDAPDRPSPEPSPAASAAPSVVVSSVPVAPPGDDYGVAPAVPMPGGNGSLTGGPAWGIPGVLPSGPDVPSGADRKAEKPIGPRASVAPGDGARLLRDDLARHDRELGLGNPGGTTVANAVAEAVRGAVIPSDATAVVAVQIAGDGTVTSVSVQRFSAGDVKAWSGVARAATAALGKKKLGLAGLGPKGAVVQVSVRSSFTYPSGGGGATLVAPKITDGPPRDVMPAPTPDGGDACAPATHQDLPPLCGVGMVVGRFDVTDLVTRKHRYVRTSFQVKLNDDRP